MVHGIPLDCPEHYKVFDEQVKIQTHYVWIKDKFFGELGANSRNQVKFVFVIDGNIVRSFNQMQNQLTNLGGNGSRPEKIL
jgi:hypothetical protein